MKGTSLIRIAIAWGFAVLPMFWACQTSLPEEVKAEYSTLPQEVDFNFHIRPILADRCFSCHGPDAKTREAGLRLDLEEHAFGRLSESTGRAFVKGSLGNSKAWKRIISQDPNFQMPPPDAHLGLSPQEKALIAKWIEQGAQWKDHWAFIPLQKPPLPQIQAGSSEHPIDRFVGAKLAVQGLAPAPQASKERLIRRLSFDLTGLPPSLADIDAFLSDTTAGAYEKWVDRLLEREAYAERMTLEWLDVARYGDTHGMHMDPDRYAWPWRDWVLKAFANNMAYDEFITQQMAGDLLPGATPEQKLATAFHRNHPSSSEGGIKDEEFRQKYVQDRTNTTATAFLGLTMECASCHDHKFDPLSQKEYYQLSAFFNNLKEVGMVNEFRVTGKPEAVYASGPVMLWPSKDKEAELDQLGKTISHLHERRALTRDQVADTQAFIEMVEIETISLPEPDAYFPFERIDPYQTEFTQVHRSQKNSPINKVVDGNIQSLASGNPQLVPGIKGNALRSMQEVDIVFIKEFGTFEINEPYSAGAWIYPEKGGVFQTIMGTSGEMGNAWRGWDFYLDTLNRPAVSMISMRPQNYLQVTGDLSLTENKWHHVLFTYDGSSKASGIQLYVDGQPIGMQTDYDHLYRSIIRRWTKRKSAEFQERPMMVFRSGRFHLGENGVFTGSIDEIHIWRQCLTPLEVSLWLAKEMGESVDQSVWKKEDLLTHYLFRNHAGFQALNSGLYNQLGQYLTLIEEVPEIMVMEDMPTARPAYVLNRGQYDQPTEQVWPGTPQRVLPYPSYLPPNRFGLSKWLIDPANPLTARVAVNRYWQMIFGKGLVATPHDFGTQGALPSHPELLDWLAVYFIESGWDVKALLKTLVLSATYKQQSMATPDQRERDPENTWLARGPSYRLQAEMIRDNALAASGLLVKRMGGPSVKPYQPEGVGDFGAERYKVDSGSDLHRRSLYTYLRRTSPHPAMVAFDAPNRLVCVAKRENTNTPQQALVLLNDPQFVEASRALAERMLKEGGEKLEDQINHGFRLACGREALPTEQEQLAIQYHSALEIYLQSPRKAKDLLGVGEYLEDATLPPATFASMSLVANTLLNFDEAYMKR